MYFLPSFNVIFFQPKLDEDLFLFLYIFPIVSWQAWLLKQRLDACWVDKRFRKVWIFIKRCFFFQTELDEDLFYVYSCIFRIVTKIRCSIVAGWMGITPCTNLRWLAAPYVDIFGTLFLTTFKISCIEYSDTPHFCWSTCIYGNQTLRM